ncbi:phage tail fiber domain-containing protein [Klebsiella michiganensis]|uniref:phage tail fiber domain-containing protein n=2 Tax=Klebsiella michiganensis TaxID=1134687 RepID=UPI00373AE8A5
MSVPNQTPYNIYTANGLSTVFAYEFYLISASDIQVTINGNEVTSGYTVSGVGNTNGGEVTFLTAPANGSTVIFERVTPTYRLTDYQDNGDLLADTVNKDFDRLWMAIQRAFIYLGVALSRPLFGGGPFNADGYRIANIADPVNDQDAATKHFVVENGKTNLARTLRVPESSVGMLPGVAARKNKILAFNSQGDPIPVLPESGSAADVMIELASDVVGAASVNYIHVFNVPTRPFAYYLAKNSGDVMLAIKEAAASGESVIFESGKTYDISQNDIPFAQRTEFNGPEGSYVNFNITNPVGAYGTFDLRASNELSGGRYNRFRNLRFRYPNQVTALNETITAPVVYPPIFHGGAFESRFECLDVGNAYYAFRLGGIVNSADSGSSSRVVLDQIIGAPLYIGVSLTQVLDVPVIQNIRWNYNYVAGSTSPYNYDITLKQWMHDNAVAFRFGRIDWATITNLFAYGYCYTFFMQAWGFTGSADRLKFVGCTADHCVYPVYAQNFTNYLTFIACGFTGDRGSEFSRIAPNIIYINDVGDPDAVVSFIGCTCNNFSGSVFRTNGTTLEFIGGKIWGFGYDSSASLIRNAIELTASATVKINGTKIYASAGLYTRCVYDGGHGNSELHISGGAALIGATYESYRWDGGVDGGNKEYIERGVTIEGATTSVNIRGVVSFYQQKHDYPGISMPVSGTYQSGDEVKNMTLKIQGVAGSRYVIKSWLRVTTGSSHVLNVDWVAQKVLTGD